MLGYSESQYKLNIMYASEGGREGGREEEDEISGLMSILILLYSIWS